MRHLAMLFVLGCAGSPEPVDLPADPVTCGAGGYVDGYLELSKGEWSPQNISAAWQPHGTDNPSYLEIIPDFEVRNFPGIIYPKTPAVGEYDHVYFTFRYIAAAEVTFIVDDNGGDASCIAGRFRAVFNGARSCDTCTTAKGVVAGWFR